MATNYEQWEQDKMDNGGIIYSDDSDNDNLNSNTNTNSNTNHRDNNPAQSPAEQPDFFAGLLAKYASSQIIADPEEDQVNKGKGRNEYDLNDSFVNDEDCFEQKGVTTVHRGFFIARGHIDVIRPNVPTSPESKLGNNKKKRHKSTKKASKPKEPIPDAIHKEIEPIRVAVQSHGEVMGIVMSDRFMNGMTTKKEEYMNILNEIISKSKSKSNSKKEDGMAFVNLNGPLRLSGSSGTVHSVEVRNTYRSLLTLLMEFDISLQGKESKEMGSPLKYSIYGELAAIFGWDVDAKGLQVE